MACSRNRELDNFVNTNSFSVVELEKALTTKLREVLASVPWLDAVISRFPTISDKGFDLLVKVKPPTGMSRELWVQFKADPRPSQFPYAFVAKEEDPQSVLVFAAPLITPNMAQTVQENGWSWFDLAGNCHLNIPNVLLIERKGNAPVHKSPRPSANLSTPESARVIRALLVPEHVGKTWTQREMQLHCEPNVSLGLVNKVVRHLTDEAYVELVKEGFRIRDPFKLLTAWRDAYRFDRHTQHRYFTLKKGSDLQQALGSLESITGGHAAYCAFTAADFQAPHVRQAKTWLFVGSEWEDAFASALEAKRVDTGENMTVLLPEDPGVFYLQESEGNKLACTNPVQTYVDLWHCGGRGQEAAEALLEQKLKPEWKLRIPA